MIETRLHTGLLGYLKSLKEKNNLNKLHFKNERMKVIQRELILTHSLRKNLVWRSHNFLLPYITVEEYCIICFTFIFNLYFQWFAVDELPAFIATVNKF